MARKTWSLSPRLEEEIAKEMALSPLYGRIVAIGLLGADGETPLTWVGEDEREMLELFWHHAQGCELFISWNGLGFDVSWLQLRSMICGVQPTVHISTARFRYPGESNHVDLYALITSWQGNRSRWLKLDLTHVCRALGVEPPVGDGAEVPALVEQGDWGAIKRHLESDLRATLALWQRLGCPGAVKEPAIPF